MLHPPCCWISSKVLPYHQPICLACSAQQCLDCGAWQIEEAFPAFQVISQPNYRGTCRSLQMLLSLHWWPIPALCFTAHWPHLPCWPCSPAIDAGQTEGGPTEIPQKHCHSAHKGPTEASCQSLMTRDQPLLTDRQQGSSAHRPPAAIAVPLQRRSRNWCAKSLDLLGTTIHLVHKTIIL